MSRPVFTAGQRVRLPGGGAGTVIAPADAAGLVLVEVADRSLVPVPTEHLTRRETTQELAARAALRPRTGRVLHLGAVRERGSTAEQAPARGDAPSVPPPTVGGPGQGEASVPPRLGRPADTGEAA